MSLCRTPAAPPKLRSSIPHPHPLIAPHRFITGVENAIDRIPILVGFARHASFAHTLDEVPHLALIAVSERFFGQGARPAEIDIRLLHNISGGLGGEACDRGRTRHIGEDRTFRPMDFVAKVETALSGPGKLAMAETSAVQFQHQQRIIFTLRLIPMHERAAPRHHFDYLVLLAEEVARGLDTVTGEVVHRAPARLLDVPKVRTVRPAVRFPRTYPDHAAYAAILNGFASLHYRRREHFRLGVAVQLARLAGRVQHRSRFVAIARERLGAYLVAPGPCQRFRHRPMLLIRQR